MLQPLRARKGCNMPDARPHPSRPMRLVTSHVRQQFPDVGSPGQPNA